MIIFQGNKAYNISEKGNQFSTEVTLPEFIYVQSENTYKTVSIQRGKAVLNDVPLPSKAMLKHYFSITHPQDVETAKRIISNAGWDTASAADAAISEHFSQGASNQSHALT